MTRPPNMSPIQWKAEAKWIRTNLDTGLAKKLKPKQQARFDEYYPFTKQWRDSQALSNAFDVVPGGFIADAAANTTNNNDNNEAA